MASYLDKRAKARKAFAKKGERATFTITTEGGYVPGSGIVGGQTVNVTGYGLLVGYSIFERKNTGIVDGSSKFIFVPDDGQEDLQIGMKIDWFGDKFSIIKTNPVKLTGDVILYNAEVSKD